MINTKDVLRMKVPYPSINDELALSPHMYICKTANALHYEFIKCQTLKPYMIYSGIFNHYVDEPADQSRNPFQRTTRIDCDKVFTTSGVSYHDALKTTNRPDVCQALFDVVISELVKDGYGVELLNEEALVRINSLITKI